MNDRPDPTLFKRAVVTDDGDFIRRRWELRNDPTIAVVLSICLLGRSDGYPPQWTVIKNDNIVSRHRKCGAAVKVAVKLQQRPTGTTTTRS